MLRRCLIYLWSYWSAFGAACTYPFPPVTNPTLAQYVSDLQAGLAAARAMIAALPQPKIILRGQLVLAAGNRISSNTPCSVNYPLSGLISGAAGVCMYDDYVVQDGYIDAMKRAGALVVDLNLGVMPLGASPEYASAWAAEYAGAGAAELPNDCATSGTLAFGATPKSGDGFWCQTLAVLDEMMKHAHSQGMSVRLAPSPSGETQHAYCGLGSTSALADLEKCYKPAYAAAAARWGTTYLTGFTPIHEPSGIWESQSGMAFTVPMIDSFLADTAAVINAAAPGLPVGADVGTLTRNSSENNFLSDWIANLSRTLNFFAVDLYPNSADAALYAAQGQWMCQSANPLPYYVGGPAATDSCIAGGVVNSSGTALNSCTPVATDYNGDCEWTVTSDSREGRGVLAIAYTGIGTAAFTRNGSIPVQFTGGAGRNGTGCLLVSGGVPGAIAITNIGNAYTAAGPNGFQDDSANTAVDGNVCDGNGAGMTGTAAAASTTVNLTTGGVLTLLKQWVTMIKATGLPWQINESNRPVYTQYSCAPTGTRSVFDNNYAGFYNAGSDVAWQNTMLAWASAMGAASMSVYATQTWVWYDPVNQQDGNHWGAAGYAGCPDTWSCLLPHLAGTSASGLAWKYKSAWNSTALEGYAHSSGKVRLGR